MRHGVDRLHWEACEARDVGTRGRPEGREVAPDQQLAPRIGACVRRADPRLGEPVEIGATVLPRAGWRGGHEVYPQADRNEVTRRDADSIEDLLLPLRTVDEQRAASFVYRAKPSFFRSALRRTQPPVAQRLVDGGRERPEVALRDEVDRRAHQGRLDRGATFERASEVVSTEPFEPRPQADVAARRILVLEAVYPLERAKDRQAPSLQQ